MPTVMARWIASALLFAGSDCAPRNQIDDQVIDQIVHIIETQFGAPDARQLNGVTGEEQKQHEICKEQIKPICKSEWCLSHQSEFKYLDTECTPCQQATCPSNPASCETCAKCKRFGYKQESKRSRTDPTIQQCDAFCQPPGEKKKSCNK